MLNFALKGTFQDKSGYEWDYYRDDQLDPNPDPNAFYIIPRPQFVMNNNLPSIGITTYQTSGTDNGSGVCRFDVELSVPGDIEDQISQAIMGNATKFPGVTKPNFISLALNPGNQAGFSLMINGSNTTFMCQASNYGSNVASFLIQLSKTQLQAMNAALVNQGGAFDLLYYLSVPARLQGVSAILTFDSAVAYQYQVTQPTYDSWGDQTSPGSVHSMLQESASSSVNITWGIENPPQTLVKDVTAWANSTLADLVSAEVEQAIKLQGIQSGESFNINEVSSFTNTYAENMVVNWLIQPTATLPSFPNLGLNIIDFTQTVNTQQQVMTVATNIPFAADNDKLARGTGPGGVSSPALIKSVDITVYYPTIPTGQTTFKLTANGSKTVTAGYDTTQGADWAISYVVNYEQNPSQPTIPSVGDKVTSIERNTYTLQVQECGILTVEFDASQAFSSEGLKPIEVDVNFSYVTDQGVNPINQVLKFFPTNTKQTITSLQAFPINKGYNYQVTYVFPGSVTYAAPLVQNKTGFQQIIQAADAMHSVNLIVFESANQATNDPLLEVTVNMWYDGTVNTPSNFAGTLPTKASPAVFTLTPNPDGKGNLIARDVFVGLATADQPLMYAATIDSGTGEVDIAAQPIENTQPSIMVTATQRYFTVEISPAAIAWGTAAFCSVEVLITPTVAQGTASSGNGTLPQQAFTWNKGELGSKYVTLAIQNGNVVSYNCEVNYITPGKVTQTLTTTALKDVIFNIQATSGK